MLPVQICLAILHLMPKVYIAFSFQIQNSLTSYKCHEDYNMNIMRVITTSVAHVPAHSGFECHLSES